MEAEMERWLVEAVERLSGFDNTVVPFQVRQALETDRLVPIKQALNFKGVYKRGDDLLEIARLLGALSADEQCAVRLAVGEAAFRAGDSDFALKCILALLSTSRYRPAWRLCLQLYELNDTLNPSASTDAGSSGLLAPLAPLQNSNTTIRLASALVSSVGKLAKEAVDGISTSKLEKEVPFEWGIETRELLLAHALWGCDSDALSSVLARWQERDSEGKHEAKEHKIHPGLANPFDVDAMAQAIFVNDITTLPPPSPPVRRLTDEELAIAAIKSSDEQRNHGNNMRIALGYASALDHPRILFDVFKTHPTLPASAWEMGLRFFGGLTIGKRAWCGRAPVEEVVRAFRESPEHSTSEPFRSYALECDRHRVSSRETEESLAVVPSLDLARLSTDPAYRRLALFEMAETFDIKSVHAALALARRIGGIPSSVELVVAHALFILKQSDLAELKEKAASLTQLVLSQIVDLNSAYEALRKHLFETLGGHSLARLEVAFKLAADIADAARDPGVGAILRAHKQVLSRLLSASVDCDYSKLISAETWEDELKRCIQPHNIFMLARLARRLCSLTLPGGQESPLPALGSSTSAGKGSGVNSSSVFKVFLVQELKFALTNPTPTANAAKSVVDEVLARHRTSLQRLNPFHCLEVLTNAAWAILGSEPDPQGIPSRTCVEASANALEDFINRRFPDKSVRPQSPERAMLLRALAVCARECKEENKGWEQLASASSLKDLHSRFQQSLTEMLPETAKRVSKGLVDLLGEMSPDACTAWQLPVLVLDSISESLRTLEGAAQAGTILGKYASFLHGDAASDAVRRLDEVVARPFLYGESKLSNDTVREDLRASLAVVESFHLTSDSKEIKFNFKEDFDLADPTKGIFTAVDASARRRVLMDFLKTNLLLRSSVNWPKPISMPLKYFGSGGQKIEGFKELLHGATQSQDKSQEDILALAEVLSFWLGDRHFSIDGGENDFIRTACEKLLVSALKTYSCEYLMVVARDHPCIAQLGSEAVYNALSETDDPTATEAAAEFSLLYGTDAQKKRALSNLDKILADSGRSISQWLCNPQRASALGNAGASTAIARLGDAELEAFAHGIRGSRLSIEVPILTLLEAGMDRKAILLFFMWLRIPSSLRCLRTGVRLLESFAFQRSQYLDTVQEQMRTPDLPNKFVSLKRSYAKILNLIREHGSRL
uniref:Sec39 domain-containing protein n=1 Tax=Amorphochlora amoebiformis TaxID=1561963 RepID=A0A7S0DID3_9EUKA